MSDSSDLNRGRSGPAWVHYALVGVVAALIVFWRLGAAALDDHECHLALAARTMADPDPRPWIVEGVLGTEGNYIPYEIPRHTTLNHWMVPVENARPRLVKTPLPYWIVALLGRCGWGVTEWSARFPAAVGAVLLVLVTLGLGRRMLSRRAALMGAVMLATCVGFQKWGRNARPEMLLALFMTGAMGCFYLGLTARTRRTRLVWMIAFWVAMGLGNLSKQFVPLLLVWGLVGYLLWRNLAADKDDLTALRALRKFLILTGVGLVVHIAVTSVPWLHWWRVVGLGHGLGVYVTMGLALGLPMVWYVHRSNSWRQIVRGLPSATPGAIVMCVMFVPWLLYMSHLFPSLGGRVFAEQVTQRAAGTGAWSIAEPHYYLAPLLTFVLPWLPFLPGALAAPLMQRFNKHRRGLVFLFLWCVGLLALFTASAAKREHYILPALPALCLLMGFVAEDVFFRHVWIKPNLARLMGGYAVVGVAAVIGITGALILERDLKWLQCLHLLIVVSLAAVPMVIAGVQAWRGRFRGVVARIAAAMVIFYVGYWSGTEIWDKDWPPKLFATAAAESVPSNATVYHWEDPREEFRAQTVFYFGRCVPALQWRFTRTDPHLTTRELNERVSAWLEAEPDKTPWVFAYEQVKGENTVAATALAKAGYYPALRPLRAHKKDLRFMLFHRVGAAPGASTGAPE